MMEEVMRMRGNVHSRRTGGVFRPLPGVRFAPHTDGLGPPKNDRFAIVCSVRSGGTLTNTSEETAATAHTHTLHLSYCPVGRLRSFIDHYILERHALFRRFCLQRCLSPTAHFPSIVYIESWNPFLSSSKMIFDLSESQFGRLKHMSR